MVQDLLKIDPVTQRPVYFIYGCPICHPVYNALNLYRGRPQLVGDKGKRRDFAPRNQNFPVIVKLQSSDRNAKVAALQELVEHLVARKLDRLRLTTQERREWQATFAAASKQGQSMLESYPDQSAWMKECPSCSGAEGACEL